MTKPKFILERTLLEPADIILTSSGGKTGMAIRTGTVSRFTHAAIYVGGTTIEATLNGVFSKNPQRLTFDRPTDVAVFRSKRALSTSEAQQICAYARSKTGSLYSIPEAITVGIRRVLSLEETRQQFCSRLVAQSYAHIGYDLANLRNASYCTPGGLARCKAFKQVFGVVREATPVEIEFSILPDPNLEHQRHTFEWMDKVRTLAQAQSLTPKSDIQTLNDVDEFLLRHPEFDKQISCFIKESGYLDFYNIDRRINPFRYDKQIFLVTMGNQSDVIEFLEEELEKETTLFTKYANNFDEYRAYAQRCNLEYFSLQLRLYLNLISELYVRIDTVAHGYEFLQEYEVSTGIRELLKPVQQQIELGKNTLRELTISASQS